MARFNTRNTLERFNKEEGFFARLKVYKNIEVVNELTKTNNLLIILTNLNKQVDKDKMIWIDEYLPNTKIENATVCRLG